MLMICVLCSEYVPCLGFAPCLRFLPCLDFVMCSGLHIPDIYAMFKVFVDHV